MARKIYTNDYLVFENEGDRFSLGIARNVKNKREALKVEFQTARTMKVKRGKKTVSVTKKFNVKGTHAVRMFRVVEDGKVEA